MDYGHQNSQPTGAPLVSAPNSPVSPAPDLNASESISSGSNFSGPRFFTAGIGNASPDTNASGPSLNSATIDDVANFSSEAGAMPGSGQLATAETNPATMTNPAAEANPAPAPRDDGQAGAYRDLDAASQPRQEDLAALGVIRDTMPLPPSHVNAALGRAAIAARFHPQGDHISAESVNAMDNLIAEVGDADKSLADTYADAVIAREAYLRATGHLAPDSPTSDGPASNTPTSDAASLATSPAPSTPGGKQ